MCVRETGKPNYRFSCNQVFMKLAMDSLCAKVLPTCFLSLGFSLYHLPSISAATIFEDLSAQAPVSGDAMPSASLQKIERNVTIAQTTVNCSIDTGRTAIYRGQQLNYPLLVDKKPIDQTQYRLNSITSKGKWPEGVEGPIVVSYTSFNMIVQPFFTAPFKTYEIEQDVRLYDLASPSEYGLCTVKLPLTILPSRVDVSFDPPQFKLVRGSDTTVSVKLDRIGYPYPVRLYLGVEPDFTSLTSLPQGITAERALIIDGDTAKIVFTVASDAPAFPVQELNVGGLPQFPSLVGPYKVDIVAKNPTYKIIEYRNYPLRYPVESDASGSSGITLGTVSSYATPSFAANVAAVGGGGSGGSGGGGSGGSGGGGSGSVYPDDIKSCAGLGQALTKEEIRARAWYLKQKYPKKQWPDPNNDQKVEDYFERFGIESYRLSKFRGNPLISALKSAKLGKPGSENSKGVTPEAITSSTRVLDEDGKPITTVYPLSTFVEIKAPKPGKNIKLEDYDFQALGYLDLLSQSKAGIAQKNTPLLSEKPIPGLFYFTTAQVTISPILVQQARSTNGVSIGLWHVVACGKFNQGLTVTYIDSGKKLVTQPVPDDGSMIMGKGVLLNTDSFVGYPAYSLPEGVPADVRGE
jgi:hypothetical protein